jgi:serine/threonine-protein kinase RsbT
VSPADGRDRDEDDGELVGLIPMIRGTVRARIRNPTDVEDIVQETLTRVMTARGRIQTGSLAPYAAATARNLVASRAVSDQRARDRAHLLVDPTEPEPPSDDVVRQEQRSTMAAALERLSAADRDVLVAREVDDEDTRTMAERRGSTPGAVAAQLSRARARLRVEFLLISERLEPPTDRCRPVLRAISSGDRRRQDDLDSAGHLLECSCCSQVAELLREHRGGPSGDDRIRVPVGRDADGVHARHVGREAAIGVGFSTTEATLVATAISEVARNIVKFATHGAVMVTPVTEGTRRGIVVVARDAGPGIADVDQAMKDGFSTYHGLGLGLPGARRLMDGLSVESTPGEGTTVTMEKWL